MGIAPKGLSNTFARPEDSARFRSLAIDPVVGKSSRDRLAVTITALVRVSDSCGKTAISRLRHTSAQVGMMSCGRLGAKPIWLGNAALLLNHPTTAATPSTM